MKIIKRGLPAKQWPRQYEATCCASILEIEPDDIKTNRDYTGGFSGYYLDCPVCGGQPDVPTALKSEATRWQAQQERIAPVEEA
jgi:hypothetical protein